MGNPERAAALIDFRKYRRKELAEMRPWLPGEDMTGISVSEVDKMAGSPRMGDMIARNPSNHNDQWLVAEHYFLENYEVAGSV